MPLRFIDNQLISTIFHTSPVSMVVTDHTGQIVLANSYAEQTLSLTHSDITDRVYNDPKWRITDIDGNPFPESQLPFFRVKTTEKPVKNIQHAIEKTDGTRIILQINASPILDETGIFIGMVAAIEDITEAQQSKQALETSMAMLKSVFRAAPVGIGVVKNRVLDWTNDRIQSMLGYTEEELQGQSARMLYPNQKEYEYVGEEKYRQIQIHGTGTVETKWQKKSGELIDVLLSSTPIDMSDFSKGVTFSALDLTERKELEARLRQSEKMEAVGQLAGGIAHDFNNQLAGIMGYADILREEVGHDEQLSRFADNILLSVKRAADLTSQLLAFARKGKYLSVPVDMNRILFEVVSLLKHTIDKRIVIEQHLMANPSMTKGDPSQLQNAVLNLALNARDAMPEGGRLILSTEIRQIDEVYQLPLFEISKGRYLAFTVKDTGTGIDPAKQHRIFEPFFTTKEEGKGTGMGLAAVFGTVKNHLGAVQVESKKGHGTSMTLLLPLFEEARSPDLKQADDTELSTNQHMHILVVDDEKMVLQMVTTMLETLGHDICPVLSGEDAVNQFTQGRFDLVILDLMMPGMSGKEVFFALKEIRKDVKVLLCSGYAIDGEATRLLKQGAHGFIQKPFRKSALAAVIDSLFE